MKKIFILTLFSILVLVTNNAFAINLAGEYSIATTITPIDADSFIFSYAVTNINQQVGGMTGLDGFYLQVPSSAIISNVTVPPSYAGAPGFWATGTSSDVSPLSSIGGNAPEAALQPGNIWLTWWGMDPTSVYPIGTTATYSFQADGVSVGSTLASPVTYWGLQTPLSPYFNVGANYTVFSSQVQGPTSAAIPEPATMSLLGFGLLGLLGLKKRKV